MPDDADALVARLAAGRGAGLVGAAMLYYIPSQIRGSQRLPYRESDRAELVIARHLLDQRAAVILEHYEISDKRQEAARLEHAFQHHLKLGRMGVRQRRAGDGAPSLEPLPARRERSDARLDAVRDDKRLVHGKQRGKLGLVGLELLPRRPYSGVLIGGILQLDYAERQSVDEQYNVGAADVAVLGDGELVDG